MTAVGGMRRYISVPSICFVFDMRAYAVRSCTGTYIVAVMGSRARCLSAKRSGGWECGIKRSFPSSIFTLHRLCRGYPIISEAHALIDKIYVCTWTNEDPCESGCVTPSLEGGWLDSDVT